MFAPACIATRSWPEITQELEPGQQANDRPDLISRVFELYLKQLIHEIRHDKVLGNVVAHTYSVEFQKRGLPHVHMLLWFAPEEKLRSAQQYDRLVWAEIPDRNADPDLYDLVTTHMLHGPCKAHYCLQRDGRCR